MPAAKAANQVRVIGGQWRGRKLSFPDLPGLRPTPDRVRETLFNWLAPIIEGSRCLDLFAGSGALGFEAASRGAAEVVLVEQEPRMVKVLREQAEAFKATNLRIVQADAAQFLRTTPHPFDIVLLDPPFGKGLLEQSLQQLDDGWLTSNARIYLEAERDLGTEALTAMLPAGFALMRSKQTSQIGYHLAAKT